MPILGLAAIGLPSVDIVSFLHAHPGLVHEVAGHAVAHSMYSFVRRASRGASRRQTRRDMNRRRRWFVDNIIMHHKRLHDRNRELIVNNVRAKVLAKKQAAQKNSLSVESKQKSQDQSTKWRDRNPSVKERSVALRGMVDARRLRARSRWLSIANS